MNFKFNEVLTMKAYKKALFIYNPLSGNRDIATELDKIIEHFIKIK